jgi:hypothetical protein
MKNIDYTKTIYIIATVLLCAGIINQTVYYSFFNIPITNFLSISEILLLFTQDIIRYVIVLFIVIFINMIFSTDKGSLEFKRYFINYCQTIDIETRISKYLKRKKISFLTFIIVFVIFLWMLRGEAKILYLVTLAFFLETIYILLRFYIFENYRKMRLKGELKKEDKHFGLLFSYSVHFVFFVACWSIYDVRDVKYNQKYINVSFKTNYGTILSDSTKYYIGQTEKYVFLHNSVLDKTFVYKMDNIEEMYFGEINYYKKEKSFGQ